MTTTYYLPPSYFLVVSGPRLTVLDGQRQSEWLIEGAAARAVLSGANCAAADLARFTDLMPQLKPLVQALGAGAPLPLDRSVLLRGTGWRMAFVELTGRCNEQCEHCYAASSPQARPALTWPALRGVLDDVAELKFRTVQLTGGDPLLSPHCAEATMYAKAHGIADVEIFTNGLALLAPLWDELRPLGPSFAFSVYSHDPSVHDAVTVTSGSLAGTTRAIARVLDAGLPARVAIVVNERNHDQLEETIAWLEALGLPRSRIGVAPERRVGRGSAYQGPLPPSPDRVRDRMSDMQSAESTSFGGTVAVTADGTVYPCIFSRELALGSIYRERLRDILTAPIPTTVAPARLLGARQEFGSTLTCWDCAVRASILRASGSNAAPTAANGPLAVRD